MAGPARDETVLSAVPAETGPTAEVDAERFELRGELGRGGMGRVVEAVDRALERPVAIKQALSDRPADVARFEREIRITAQLEHPAIVPVHERGTDSAGRPYYVMRKIDGRPLSELVAAAPDLAARLALLPKLLAVLDAAAYAHARGVIHRDIKPPNILVGPFGETLLIDWGLARRIAEEDDDGGAPAGEASELTGAGEAFGTPGFMAPELVRGARVDAASDVYALGATLYYVLAGASPARGRTPAQWLVEAAEGAPAVPALPDGVPRELATIVGKAMAPDRTARYRDGAELAADVRAFIDGRLVAAHRYTTWERVRRFVRRHRVVVVAAAIVVAVAAIAFWKVIAERDRANDAAGVADQSRRAAQRESEVARGERDRQRVERARALARVAPTEAVALLRGIPASSEHAALASDVARTAAAHGILRGAALSARQINAVLISPDERFALCGGEDGRIYRVDLATSRSAAITGPDVPVHAVAWLGPTTIAVARQHTGEAFVEAVAIDTGDRHRIADGLATFLWSVRPGVVRFVDVASRRLVEASLREPPHVVSDDVDVGAGDGEITVTATATRIRVFEGRRQRASVEHASGLPYRVAVSTAKGRATVAFQEEAREIDLDGKPLHRWEIGASLTSLLYAGDDLAGGTPAGDVLTFGPTRIRHHNIGGSITHGTTLGANFAFAGAGGRVAIRDAAGLHDLPFVEEVRFVAGSEHYLVGALPSGELRWMNLATVIPRATRLTSPTVCASDGASVYVQSQFSLHAVDRRDGRDRVVATGDIIGATAGCRGALDGVVAMTVPALGAVLVDTRDGKIELVRGAIDVVIERARGELVYARADRLVARPPRGAEKVSWVAPAPIEWHGATGPWSVVSAGNVLYRVDRATGAASRVTSRPFGGGGAFADGSVWFVRGAHVIRWNGAVVGDATLPRAIFGGQSLASGDLVVALDDFSIWRVRDDQAMRLVGPSLRNLSGYNGSILAIINHDHGFTTLHVASNEGVFRTVDMLGNVYVGDDDTVFASNLDYVLQYPDQVPADPGQLGAWIDATTNLVADDAANTFRWAP